MRVGPLALLVFALSGAPGCLVVSLQPVYDERSVDIDDRLLGAWTNEEQGLAIEVERGEWKSYRVTVKTARETIEARAHLTHVGSRVFMDLMPSGGVDDSVLRLPVHSVYGIDIEEGVLSVTAIDYDVLRKRVESGSAGVRAALDERQNVVLTAATPALREWLARAGPRGAPFSAPIAFKRGQAG